VSAAYTIGIDIGGTKVAGGVVDSSGVIHARARADTPHRSTSPEVVENTIVGVLEDLIAQVGPGRVSAVGIGAAGFVGADRATVVFAPHLSWRQEPLRDALFERIGLPITVDNDANASSWAEWRFGAGRGESHLVMVNLGTGIGGGIVLGGRVERGRFGIAGEFGHMQVVPDGLRCECGNRGCWEQYSSGNALVREARTLLYANSPVADDLRARVGGDPALLTGPLVTEAAQAGDRTAIELLADVGRWLGVGIANLAAAFDPGVFVIGGGVSAAGELLLGPARETYRRQLTGRGYRPEARIVAAELGNDAGVIGAADLARVEAQPQTIPGLAGLRTDGRSVETVASAEPAASVEATANAPEPRARWWRRRHTE
jgi:glucokinase